MAIIRRRLVKRLTVFLPVVLLITAMPINAHCRDLPKVASVLETIPEEDQQTLKDLFHLLFRHGDFSYAFFGIKPMCSIDYTMQYIKTVSNNEAFTRETHLARKGFEVWKKYQHLFPMKDIRFLLQESDQCGGHFAFVLINPQKCLSIIEHHLHLFQNYYGEKLPADELLKCLCQGTYFKEGKIDHAVFGLLLGYPEKDVVAFSNQLEKSRSSKNKNSLRPCHLALSRNPLTPIRSSFFMTNRNEADLKDLKSEYAEKKRELVKFYYSDDFLGKILNRFM